MRTAVEEVRSEDLYSDAYADDPYPYWAWMREHAPVFWDERSRSFELTRYRDVVDVFKDSERFSNRLYRHSLGAVFGPTMLQMDGMDHVVRRTMVAPEFVGKRLKSFEPVIERNARDLIDGFRRDGGPVDLVDAFSTRLPVNVIVDMLGMSKDDHDRFHDWYTTMMAGLGPDKALQALGIEAHGQLAEYVDPIIAERQGCPAGDLISRIVQAEVDGEHLSVTELKAFISLLLTAGGETTDKSIANLWWNLLQHPDQFAEVRRDPDLFDQAFSETMRHSPPVPWQLRQADVDVELHGVTIPARSRVRLGLASANCDEAVFERPREFDLFRPDLLLTKELKAGYERDGRCMHLGFGVGKHFCLGYELARTEAVVGSKLLLEALGGDVRLVGDVPPMRTTGATRSIPRLLVAPT